MSDDDTPFNTVLSPEAFQTFVDQLDNPPEPTEKLKALMRRPSPWGGSGVKPPRIVELEKALRALADALQDEIESSMGRELTARDLPKEWHAAQRLLGHSGGA